MPVEVKKKDNESVEGMLRRFTRKLQQSGNLYTARRIRFYEKKKSKTILREEAKRQRRIKGRREWLKRMGRDIRMEKFRKTQQKIFLARRSESLKRKKEGKKKDEIKSE